MKEKLINYYSENLSRLPSFSNLDREKAFKTFEKLGFPNARMENWQKSVVKKFLDRDYMVNLTLTNGSDEVSDEVKIKDTVTVVLDFSKKNIQPFWQNESGAFVSDLEYAAKNYPDIFYKHFNRYNKTEKNGFTAINSALTESGFFVYIPKAFDLKESLHLIENYAVHQSYRNLRNLIVAEDMSNAGIFHSLIENENNHSFQNAVTEIYVGEGARFRLYKEQEFGLDTAAVNNLFVHQERDSECTVMHASIRAGMLRNEVYVRLNGEGASSNVFGLYLPGTGEQVDNQVFIDHAVPQCVSNELFKGVLNGNGSSVFNGHILVRQDAQKTNAYQKNRNILLSDSANVYAKPFLEIYADDVKCSHGATIGQLDVNALFYLQSRGLSLQKAREFLVKAFLGEILDQCNHEGFVSRVEAKIREKLHY